MYVLLNSTSNQEYMTLPNAVYIHGRAEEKEQLSKAP